TLDYDWQHSHVVRHTAAPVWVTDDGYRARPDLRVPQLVRSDSLDRVMSAPDDRILLGKRDRTLHTLWVLSDPDVLNNHGLRSPGNARFVVEMIDKLRHGGPVVIDETMHGYARQPSVVRTLFEFPLVVVTVQMIACAILVVWAAMVRFGPRRPA